MTLIAGLGNPGDKYENHRHNIGFMVIDHLVMALNAAPHFKTSFFGQLFKHKDIMLLKPVTYMNDSGKSVAAVSRFYKPDKIIVIHDDLDLQFGALKFKKGGSHGGHNGLKSIDAHIGSDYFRVRMGIGKPERKSQVISHVLNDFNAQEQKHLKEWITYSADAVKELCGHDLNTVASKYSAKSIDNVIHLSV